MEFYGHTGMVFSVEFSPDGKMILTGSGDKTARLWDIIVPENRVIRKNIEQLSKEQKKKYGID